MRLFLTSYASARFASVRRELNQSAISYGIENILSFSRVDLERTEFYHRNRRLLDEACGGGFWAWKPYFIREALTVLNAGDVLFYCDAGSTFISSPAPLAEMARQSAHGIALFDARPLTNRQFTKRDCFVGLACDRPKHWDAFKVIATVLVIRKTRLALDFVDEWLRHCQDRAAISDDENVHGPNLEGFLVHRHDQAILSVLASKHGLETYRNPTVWGNYLKAPEYRVRGETVTSPFGLVPEVRGYADVPQFNSPYGTIFAINRQPNFTGKLPLARSADLPAQTALRRLCAPLVRLARALQR